MSDQEINELPSEVATEAEVLCTIEASDLSDYQATGDEALIALVENNQGQSEVDESIEDETFSETPAGQEIFDDLFEKIEAIEEQL